MRGRWTSVVGMLVLGLLLGSALLAAMRLADPGSRRLIELVALTPLGLPLAGLALLGAVRWTGPRNARGAVVLAATSLLVVHAWWWAPLYAGPLPEGGSSGSLVVLAQNFEYGDATALVEMVRHEDVDVLVLSDVDDGRIAVLHEAAVHRWLPFSAGLGEGGTVVLSRVPITGTRLLYDESASRLVELRVPALGQVTLAALHTAPPYRPESWHADHDRIHAALARLRSNEDAAVVLAGDLNATLAHAPVRRLLALGFSDAAAQVNAGWSPTWPTGGHERRWGIAVPTFVAIDHVLTSPRLVVTDAETLALEGADHRAVLATISGAG